MKRLLITLSVVAIFLLNSCEVSPEDEARVHLLPINMSETVIMGVNTIKIIADFHYLPNSDFVDHITWSNHQTHYFTYDASNKLSLLSKLKVKEKVQEEFYFSYEGELVSEVILVKKNLDYAYLEPIDSTFTGRIEYEYNGNLVVRESEYGVQKGNNKEYLVREVSFEYDYEGNMISRKTSLQDGGEMDEKVLLTYDSGKHPLSGLAYYFNGESFVNNPLTKTLGTMEYSYDITLNSEKYPELIYEKLGSTHTRIFKYTYKTK